MLKNTRRVRVLFRCFQSEIIFHWFY